MGTRFHMVGYDYDLCEAEFGKLSEQDRTSYEVIARPGTLPVRYVPWGSGGGAAAAQAPAPAQAPVAVAEPVVVAVEATPAPAPAPAPEPEPVMSAVFEMDATLPDGTVVEAGVEVSKKWTVKNNGTVAWPVDTTVKYVEGEMVGTTTEFAVGELQPGASTDVEVTLITGSLCRAATS